MTTTMKLHQETGEPKINRKLLKPQVERRRRERMNRSLEGLRHLLLQDAQQEGGAQRRIEKAEILERTVHFLHNAAEGSTKTEGCRVGPDSFKDGFSSCIQRAVHYLGQRGEGLRPEATLDAALAARFSSNPASLPGTAKRSASSPQTHQLLSIRHLIKSRHGRQSTRGDTMSDAAVCRRSPGRHASLAVAQHPLRPSQAESRSQSLSRSGPSLWRPWP